MEEMESLEYKRQKRGGKVKRWRMEKGCWGLILKKQSVHWRRWRRKFWKEKKKLESKRSHCFAKGRNFRGIAKNKARELIMKKTGRHV